MTAFGSSGPMAGRPGYEMALQAYGGIMSITGTEEGGRFVLGRRLTTLVRACGRLLGF